MPNHLLNPRLATLEPSVTLAINERSRALAREGKEIFQLGFGQSPFPVPYCLLRALQENAARKEYLPAQGLPDLRSTIAGYIERTQRINCSTNDIIIGPGSKELMFLLQLVIQHELIVPTPAWVSYIPQAKMLGKPHSEIATQRDADWKLRPDALDAHCVKNPSVHKLLVLNYPNNPTGHTYTEDELKELAIVARKHQVLILSDEIYGGLHFSGNHISIARFYPEGTILGTGLSKSWGAGGWRLGAFVVPPSMRSILERMCAAASETFSCVSAPIQYASIPAFEERDEISTYQVECRRILNSLGDCVASKLRDTGAKCSSPQGGFYVFPDWTHLADNFSRRAITNCATLCETLLNETGVATLAGSAFGGSKTDLNLRIAFVDFDGTAALEALSTRPNTRSIDTPFLELQCSKVIEGIQRLCHWIK